MSGLYLHIPFCRQKCHYCNFHFSVSLRRKKELLAAVGREIELSAGYLDTQKLSTVYFGGGTPSLLSGTELAEIIQRIKDHYLLSPDMEFTLEANPDDMEEGFLEELLKLGVNRLSLGVQSFIDGELKMMNRAHDAGMAQEGITRALRAGFRDISIDLIFGMPGSDLKSWQYNLERALSFKVPHYSIYNLTVEPGTALAHQILSGIVRSTEEEMMAEQFLLTMDTLEKAGYEHYEISNYALPDKYARHNTAYWQGTSYLGIGPSAHSFNGYSRRWNVANNPRYIKSIELGLIPFEQEMLTKKDRYNEYILTGLRTMWGCSREKINQLGAEWLKDFHSMAEEEIHAGRMVFENGFYRLTRKGKLFADEISSSLFAGN